MKIRFLALALAAGSVATWAAGCGEDTAATNGQDGGLGSPDGALDPAAPDGGDSGAASACGNSDGVSSSLLLTINGVGDGGKFSEMAAFDLATKTVLGRYSYRSVYAGTYTLGTDPWIVAEEQDQVIKMNAKQPWLPVSTWNVAGDDVPDGGEIGEPLAVAVPACGKGYVARAYRNKLAIIDTAAAGGTPTKYIDLAPYRSTADGDGIAGVAGAIYVPAKKRLYVLIGNYDLTKLIYKPFFASLCNDGASPTILGIDTDTDHVVSLGGSGRDGSIVLGGYNPILGSSAFRYDAANDRLLVLEGGCNKDVAGAPGAVERRRVEAASLTTGAVSTLLELGAGQFPMTMAYVDGARAALTIQDDAYANHTFLWNPSSTALGSELPYALDALGTDGKGNLVGAHSTLTNNDAGIDIVSLPFADGGVDAASIQTLGSNPFTQNEGFLNGADLWPHP